jgi:adenosine kinase
MATSSIMSTLICGSIAYDSIMVFEGRFADHILPHQVHILNVSFLVPEMRREFGGCAGNISYNLKLLGGEPLPMATVGSDAQPYLERLDALGINRRFIRQLDGAYTAQAFITTDMDDNQITAFHPGAMNQSHLNAVPGDGSVRLAIVAPDGRDGMLQHAQQLADHGIPFIFDPGQGLPMFSGEELLWFIQRADFVAVNDYEARLLTEKTGLGLEELGRKVRALIATRGAEGSEIHVNGEVLPIPIASARKLVDPTGCGDAYRAGLLYGITNDLDWEVTGRLAAVMGSLKIEHSGGQNHAYDRGAIAERFNEAFGYRPW